MNDWKKWISHGISFERKDLEVTLDTNGLCLISKQANSCVTVTFSGIWYSYKTTITEAFQKKIELLQKNCSDPTVYAGNSFRLDNSDYLKWHEDETYGLYQRIPEEISHYILIGSNVTCEVLYSGEPEIVIENFK